MRERSHKVLLQRTIEPSTFATVVGSLPRARKHGLTAGILPYPVRTAQHPLRQRRLPTLPHRRPSTHGHEKRAARVSWSSLKERSCLSYLVRTTFLTAWA